MRAFGTEVDVAAVAVTNRNLISGAAAVAHSRHPGADAALHDIGFSLADNAIGGVEQLAGADASFRDGPSITSHHVVLSGPRRADVRFDAGDGP